MRTGLIFPVSNGVLGFAFIAALVIGFLYVIFYLVQSASDSSSRKSLEDEFLSHSAENKKMDLFGLPSPSDSGMIDRSIDATRGYIYTKTPGRISIAICRHAKLDYLRLCFAVDYAVLGEIQAIAYILQGNEKNMVKITPETAMFGADGVRFYECNVKSLAALYSTNFRVQLGPDEIYPTAEEKDSIRKTIDYVFGLDLSYKKKFLNGGILLNSLIVNKGENGDT